MSNCRSKMTLKSSHTLLCFAKTTFGSCQVPKLQKTVLQTFKK